jgi:hypothetical protein
MKIGVIRGTGLVWKGGGQQMAGHVFGRAPKSVSANRY